MPAVPPQRLVVVGFYRFVRNPMYVGFAVGWIGLWIVFGTANLEAIAGVVVVAVAVHLDSWSFMKNRRCAANSVLTTTNIAATFAAGSRVVRTSDIGLQTSDVSLRASVVGLRSSTARVRLGHRKFSD